jgi:hypothetical protein
VAAIAFAIAFFNFAEVLVLLVLIVGYALIAEGNNWLTKQTLQALYLRLSLSILLTVIGWIFYGFNFLLGTGHLYGVQSVMNNLQNVFDGILYVLMLAACIVAVVRVVGGKDANLPLFGTLADKSLGLFTKKVAPSNYQYPQQPAPGPYAAPSQYTAPGQYTAPAQPVAPVKPAAPVQPATVLQPEAPVQPVVPVQPAASETWTCSCGRINTGKFCAGCGAKNPNLS